MNSKQRRTNARQSLAAVGGIGAKVINKATGKIVAIIGKGDKPYSIRVIRGDRRKLSMRVNMLTKHRCVHKQRGAIKMQQEINLKFSDGKLWEIDADETGEYESEVTTFTIIDRIANADKHLWALQHKSNKQRRWLWSSLRCKSIGAMIDTVKIVLAQYPNDKVRAITPDLIVNFYKD